MKGGLTGLYGFMRLGLGLCIMMIDGRGRRAGKRGAGEKRCCGRWRRGV